MARFWELELVRRAPDLYRLTAEQLLELDGFQQRSAEHVDRLDRAARGERPFGRLLFGLGIPHVGGVTAEAIAQHFRSLAALRAAGPDEIAEVEGVGPIVAESVAAWLGVPGQRGGARRPRRRPGSRRGHAATRRRPARGRWPASRS